MTDFFADSYAVVGFLEGNPRYVRIFRHRQIVTSAFNVLEVYSTILRRLDPTEARRVAVSLLGYVAELPPELALAAGAFRHRMRALKRDCSYVDAWGYSAAEHLQVPFLTGDPAFKGLDRVEFVR